MQPEKREQQLTKRGRKKEREKRKERLLPDSPADQMSEEKGKEREK